MDSGEGNHFCSGQSFFSVVTIGVSFRLLTRGDHHRLRRLGFHFYKCVIFVTLRGDRNSQGVTTMGGQVRRVYLTLRPLSNVRQQRVTNNSIRKSIFRRLLRVFNSSTLRGLSFTRTQNHSGVIIVRCNGERTTIFIRRLNVLPHGV